MKKLIITTLKHALIDMDSIDKITDTHGLSRFNLLRKELTDILNKLEVQSTSTEIEILETIRKFQDNCDLEGVEFEINDEDATNLIQQYAESYHTKKCTKCKEFMTEDDVSDREA